MKNKRTIPEKSINPLQIASCGMNCSLCYAYIREKNSCPGCQGPDDLKAKSCAQCRIKNCATRIAGEYKFCYLCSQYPCPLIKHIDKRYRSKYAMSMIENLEYIKKFGIRKFIAHEKKEWTCANCGKIICVHKKLCLFCEYDWRATK